MTVYGRETVRYRMLLCAADRLGQERSCMIIVRGKRYVRLLTNLVSLRMPEEDGVVQVRDMHL